MSEDRYLVIPGDEIFNLPSLLITTKRPLSSISAKDIVQAQEALLDEYYQGSEPQLTLPQLQASMVEKYWEIQELWRLGNDIHSWTNDCQWGLEMHTTLGEFFKTSLWPHDHKTRLTELIRQKNLFESSRLQIALGLRLTFRLQPTLEIFSDTCLTRFASTAFREVYAKWLENEGNFLARLPPDRFNLEIRPKEEALYNDLESLA